MRDTSLRISIGSKGRKLFRLDTPSHPLAEQDGQTEAESGRLWSLIWGKVQSASQERRGGVRHPAVSHEIWVGWSTRDQFEAIDGLLINISRGGALIVLKSRPPRDRPVWVYKQVASSVWSVRGGVVGHTPGARRRLCCPVPVRHPLPHRALRVGGLRRSFGPEPERCFADCPRVSSLSAGPHAQTERSSDR